MTGQAGGTETQSRAEPATARVVRRPGRERRPVLILGPTPPPYHGVAVYTAALLEQLGEEAASGPYVHLDTSDRRSLSNLGRFDWGNARLALRHSIALARLLARYRPAAVYLPISRNRWAYLRDAVLIALAKLAGSRVVTHLHGSDLRRFYEGASAPWRWLVRGTSRRLDAALVLGDGLRSEYDGLVAPARVRVVPVGAPDPFAGSPPDRRGRLGRPTALYIGSLAPGKGTAELVAALRSLAGDGAAPALVLAGEWVDDGFRERVMAEVAGLGPDAAVTVLPPVDGAAKRRLLEEADLVVFPAGQPEGLPLLVLEAMAAALPVVATDTGAVTDAVAHGKTGYVVPPGDVDALAQAIGRLTSSSAERVRMGQAGRERYEERFTLERSARELDAMLESLCTR